MTVPVLELGPMTVPILALGRCPNWAEHIYVSPHFGTILVLALGLFSAQCQHWAKLSPFWHCQNEDPVLELGAPFENWLPSPNTTSNTKLSCDGGATTRMNSPSSGTGTLQHPSAGTGTVPGCARPYVSLYVMDLFLCMTLTTQYWFGEMTVPVLALGQCQNEAQHIYQVHQYL